MRNPRVGKGVNSHARFADLLPDYAPGSLFLPPDNPTDRDHSGAARRHWRRPQSGLRGHILGASQPPRPTPPPPHAHDAARLQPVPRPVPGVARTRETPGTPAAARPAHDQTRQIEAQSHFTTRVAHVLPPASPLSSLRRTPTRLALAATAQGELRSRTSQSRRLAWQAAAHKHSKQATLSTIAHRHRHRTIGVSLCTRHHAADPSIASTRITHSLRSGLFPIFFRPVIDRGHALLLGACHPVLPAERSPCATARRACAGRGHRHLVAQPCQPARPFTAAGFRCAAPREWRSTASALCQRAALPRSPG